MTTTGPHEKTVDEVREDFLRYVRTTVKFWAATPGTDEHRCMGVAFSILVALDGGAVALPRFIVAPDPHQSDEAYRKAEGANWYPDNNWVTVKCDIAGALHEHLHKDGTT